MFSKRVVITLAVVGLAYLVSLRNSNKAKSPVIAIENGQIRGVISKSRDGRPFYEYLGIPYAKPPVGQRRFEPPELPNNWNGIREGNSYGTKCVQIDLMSGSYTGEEDCLFLNVFTPKIVPDGKLLPVMFFVHGGLFHFGSSNLYRPEYFMDEDVVMVTMNYRLAALGFLNTGDGIVRGNMGLKDQTMALQWAQKNIKKFNGDPDNVLLFGESAGGASVHFHILSPMSQGLFHKAISQSGVALNPWAMYYDPVSQARNFANNLKCPVDEPNRMVACLKNVKAKELVEIHREVQNPLRDPMTVFVPTLEVPINDGKTFLSEHPLELLKSGRFSKVPFMAGVNSEEGLINSAVIMRNLTVLERANDEWLKIAPSVLMLRESNPEDLYKIKDYYFGKDVAINNVSKFPNFTRMFSDRTFFVGLHNAAMIHANYSSIYLYYYHYAGEFTLVNFLLAVRGNYNPIIELAIHVLTNWVNKNIFGILPPSYGVCHSDEIALQFLMPWMSDIGSSDKDYEMSKKIINLWTTFATNENELKIDGSHWPPIDVKNKGGIKFLELDEESTMINEPFFERVEFWNSLNVI